jgi:hypothetical protein
MSTDLEIIKPFAKRRNIIKAAMFRLHSNSRVLKKARAIQRKVKD